MLIIMEVLLFYARFLMMLNARAALERYKVPYYAYSRGSLLGEMSDDSRSAARFD